MSRRGKRKALSHRKMVEEFLRCVQELKDRPFILKGLREFEFRIDLQAEPGKIICELKEADEEHLRSFIMTFRKFLLNDEPANIDRILNICIEFAKPEQKELKHVLQDFKTIWSYQYRTGTIRMTTNSLSLNPAYVLDLWLNGYYIHNKDPEKSKMLNSLLKQDLPSVRIQLLWSLPTLTDTIIRIGAVLSKAVIEEAFDFPKEEQEMISG
jgi:hypothetical protein